jgi:hypothetical protein
MEKTEQTLAQFENPETLVVPSLLTRLSQGYNLQSFKHQDVHFPEREQFEW